MWVEQVMSNAVMSIVHAARHHAAEALGVVAYAGGVATCVHSVTTDQDPTLTRSRI